MDRKQVWKHGLVIALGVAGLGLAAAPAQAQPVGCSAATNNTPVYCGDDTDVGWGTSTCNPNDIQWGDPSVPTTADTVTITIEVANASLFNWPGLPAPPPNAPPEGQLTAGSTIKVFYACAFPGSPACQSGSEYANWLIFDSVANNHPDVSFADDGNGYSGTLTINNNIPFAQGDPAPLKLIRLNLTAGNATTATPAGPVVPGSIIQALSGQPANDTSASMFQLTDSACPIPGLTGGGQGTTNGQFAAPPPGTDDCIDIAAHRNKQVILGTLPLPGPQVGRGRVAIETGDNATPFDRECSDGWQICYDNSVGGLWCSTPAVVLSSSKADPRCMVHKSNSPSDELKFMRVCKKSKVPGDFNVNWKVEGTIQPILQDAVMDIVIRACGTDYRGPQPPKHPDDPTWRIKPGRWQLPFSAWSAP